MKLAGASEKDGKLVVTLYEDSGKETFEISFDGLIKASKAENSKAPKKKASGKSSKFYR